MIRHYHCQLWVINIYAPSFTMINGYSPPATRSVSHHLSMSTRDLSTEQNPMPHLAPRQGTQLLGTNCRVRGRHSNKETCQDLKQRRDRLCNMHSIPKYTWTYVCLHSHTDINVDAITPRIYTPPAAPRFHQTAGDQSVVHCVLPVFGQARPPCAAGADLTKGWNWSG